MPKKITLFFGSFNPVHNGHVAIAEYMVSHGLCDELWIIISPQNPFKSNEELAPERDRLAMARIAIKESSFSEYIKVSDIEFSLSKPSYTVNTLRILRERYPDHEFSILMGEDNILLINKWKNYHEIINNCRIFVYKRRSYCFPQGTITEGDIVLLDDDAPYLDISSTEIRDFISQGKDISGLVPQGVAKYIVTHRIYDSSDND